MWRAEQSVERVLLPFRQSEANLLQCKTTEQRYVEALVWGLWCNLFLFF